MSSLLGVLSKAEFSAAEKFLSNLDWRMLKDETNLVKFFIEHERLKMKISLEVFR